MNSQSILAVPLLFIMTASWSYMLLLISLFSSRIDWVVVLWLFALANLFVSIPLAIYFRQTPFGPSDLSGLWRCQLLTVPTMEALCKVLLSISLSGCPMGDAATLWNTNVVWVTVFQSLLERRFPRAVQIGAIVLALTGVVLIQKPTFVFGDAVDAAFLTSDFPDRKYFYVLALFISFPYAIYFTLTDHLQRRGVHWSVFYLNYTLAVLAAAMAFSLPAPMDRVRQVASLTALEACGVVLIGVFEVLGRAGSLFALQYFNADVVAIFALLEIPVTYFLGFKLLGQMPDVLGVAGSALIFFALVALTVVEAFKKRGKDE